MSRLCPPVRRSHRLVLALAALLALFCSLSVSGARADDPWADLDAAARATVQSGETPGVVLLVGHRGKVVYRKAFGNRSVQPAVEAMTPDTVFDLASLTKVVATTSCVMDLVERGRLRLNDRVVTYWPEFGANGKDKITIRQLLTHTSGLAAWDNYLKRFGDPQGPAVQDHTPKVMEALAAASLSYPTDTRFVYSDLGFITLGELVRRVSGEPLDVYARKHIFEPLGMKETGYHLSESLKPRTAPTTAYAGEFRRGAVHDPNAAVMGGVAGHAGLFSTADDLARFARMLLSSDGRGSRRYPLAPATIRTMTSPHSPERVPMRGLGWDIDSPYSHVRGDLLPVGSFGHTGFTGTYIWVDPYSESFVIGLANRVHPGDGGNVLPLWARAANVTAGIVRPQELPERKEVTPRMVPVLTGIDVLQRDGFKLLEGRTVGLITNRTGINRDRVSTIDLLHSAPNVRLAALFSPEHGLRADLDEEVPSSRDEKTGLPIHSLYGQGKYKPTPEQLRGLDTLVFDIQDIGVRYYTYISTLGLCMQAAAENGLRFVVLDRPNPVNGLAVEGPLLQPGLESFIAHHRLPVRHGMTVGELAQLFNAERKINADLQVVRLENWRRDRWFDETGQPWVNPSPNIRNTLQAELYPGIGLIEGVNLSVGRGTDTPFERVGAPWIDGEKLSLELNRRRIPGLRFVPVTFTPTTREFKGERCEGVDIRLLDREAFDGTRTAIEILDALVRLFPGKPKIEPTARWFGSRAIPEAILRGDSMAQIVASYRDDVESFRRSRQKYLLYR
ncbi:MAG: exo-beta-N-acetylmuramidase NamZ domain-containing protein [Armatimonadota bacterium]